MGAHFLLSLLVLAAPAPRFAVVPLGTHHGGEFRVLGPLGNGWSAPVGERLMPVRVEARAVRDEVVDTDRPSSVKTGRRLRVAPRRAEQAGFVLRGLEPGPVSPLRLPEETWLGSGRPLVLGEAQLLRESEGELHRLVLATGPTRQRLYDQDGGELESWSLAWAGDLDGDGRLDLVLKADRSGNITTWRLFLSSRAGPGELIHEVAHYTQSGC